MPEQRRIHCHNPINLNVSTAQAATAMYMFTNAISTTLEHATQVFSVAHSEYKRCARETVQ